MKENRKFESIENNKVPKYSFKLNNKKNCTLNRMKYDFINHAVIKWLYYVL